MPNDSAVANREALTGPVIEVGSVAGRGNVERVETTIELPAGFQYVIPGTKKVNGQNVPNDKVGITSDGYDYINRVLGVSFYLPDFVPDQDAVMRHNPIHRSDGYVYIRMGGLWYNEAGQLVGAVEDLEVDPKYIYQSARLESWDSEVVLHAETKQPIYDADGMPFMKLKDAAAEKKALKALFQVRTMGMRYAQTVLRVRIMKQATGIKSLPIPAPRPFKLRIVGYRDAMNPVERQAAATTALSALYGRKPDAKPLSASDFAGIEGPNAEDQTEQTLLEATGLAQPMFDEQPAPSDEFDVTPPPDRH